MPTKRPSRAYSTMFSSILFGLYFFVTGLIGYRVDVPAALAAGSHWAGKPIVSQVALGTALLLVGAYLFRRLGVGRWMIIRGGTPRRIRNVGKGRSAGAEDHEHPRRLPSRSA